MELWIHQGKTLNEFMLWYVCAVILRPMYRGWPPRTHAHTHARAFYVKIKFIKNTHTAHPTYTHTHTYIAPGLSTILS